MYAPEHLIVNVEDAEDWLPQLDNAGSVFLGRWTPESVGDYASGTNHVLPTYVHHLSLLLLASNFNKLQCVQDPCKVGSLSSLPNAV